MASASFSVKTLFSAVDNMTTPLKKMKMGVADLQLSTQKGLNAIGGKWIERGITALTVGSVGMGMILKSAVQTAAEFESIETSIRFISGGGENAQKNMDFLKSTVTNLRTEYSVTAESFKRFLGAMKSTDIAADKQRDMFGKMAVVTRVLGMNTENTEATFRALGEMFSKGQVMSQELKVQLGNALPGAVSFFAKSMGKSNKEFLKLVQSGKVGTENIAGFIDYVYEQYKGGLPSAIKTTQSALTNLGNQWKMMLDTIGRAISESGALDFLSDIMTQLRSWVEVNKELIKQKITSIVNSLVSAFKWIYNNWDAIVEGLKIWIGIWARLKIINGLLTVTNNLLTVMGIGLRVSSPIILGLTTIAGLWFKIASNTRDAENANRKYKLSLKDSSAPALTREEFKSKYIRDNQTAGKESYDRIMAMGGFDEALSKINEMRGSKWKKDEVKMLDKIYSNAIDFESGMNAAYQKYSSDRSILEYNQGKGMTFSKNDKTGIPSYLQSPDNTDYFSNIGNIESLLINATKKSFGGTISIEINNNTDSNISTNNKSSIPNVVVTKNLFTYKYP